MHEGDLAYGSIAMPFNMGRSLAVTWHSMFNIKLISGANSTMIESKPP